MSILPIKIDNFSYAIGDSKILRNININSKEKKITIIAGNNGSGKTTLLKAMHGLIEDPSNSISWANNSIKTIKELQSMVFQNPILLNRTTFENILYVANKKKINEKNHVNKIIEKLNIKDIANIDARYLSGGEKQKVAIAMSIIGNPKIIFLDEPTSQLDPAYKHEIESIISSLVENDTKIFMTSHDISQIKRIGEEIIFLDKGRIIFNGKVKEFLNEKTKKVIRNYISYG
tara:strand:+ start:477 stop:1172 length:696 start_codon:yes stop_codon:yes gene_type:complete